jgi:hypothetical protein
MCVQTELIIGVPQILAFFFVKVSYFPEYGTSGLACSQILSP